jgi:hypothetical protein
MQASTDAMAEGGAMESKTYLEVADAARLAGVCAATIKAAVSTGRLRVAAVTVRGSRLFDQREVERYARSRDAERQHLGSLPAA